jgi:hypothetical protein
MTVGGSGDDVNMALARKMNVRDGVARMEQLAELARQGITGRRARRLIEKRTRRRTRASGASTRMPASLRQKTAGASGEGNT